MRFGCPERWSERRYDSPLPFAPDICVEVLSPGYTDAEVQMKIAAYPGSGAREVVVIGLRGEIHFLGPDGVRESAYGLQFDLPPALFVVQLSTMRGATLPRPPRTLENRNRGRLSPSFPR